MTKTTENELEQSAVDSKGSMNQAYTDAEAKRAQLEAKYKCKVKMAFLAAPIDEKPCVAYFKTATTFTKTQCIDMAEQSRSKAAERYFEATVLKEESDPRVFIRDNDDDVFYLGALDWCKRQINGASALVKKK
jgi:hypothetical protein